MCAVNYCRKEARNVSFYICDTQSANHRSHLFVPQHTATGYTYSRTRDTEIFNQARLVCPTAVFIWLRHGTRYQSIVMLYLRRIFLPFQEYKKPAALFFCFFLAASSLGCARHLRLATRMGLWDKGPAWRNRLVMDSVPVGPCRSIVPKAPPPSSSPTTSR